MTTISSRIPKLDEGLLFTQYKRYSTWKIIALPETLKSKTKSEGTALDQFNKICKI